MGVHRPDRAAPAHAAPPRRPRTNRSLRRAVRVARARASCSPSAPADLGGRLGARRPRRVPSLTRRSRGEPHDHRRRADRRRPRRPRRAPGLGRRRRRAQPGHRRDPPRGPHRVDRRAPRGGRARSPPARRPSSPARSASAWAPSGPGSIHLLNGLYDAKKSHAPVLAICGQVPRAEIGSDFFQEVDNDALFADVAVFRADRHQPPSSCPALLEQAVNAALAERGVAVLTLPGDVGGLDLPKGTRDAALRRPPAARRRPTPDALREAAARDRRRRRRSPCSSGMGARRRPRRGARSSPSGSRRRWC